MTQLELGAMLTPGEVLAGKYRIERVLGMGGMGVVAAAHHLHLDQRVAIKLMLAPALANGEAVGRFLREARAAARISSEHVARVFDVGSLESGEPYIAMEYLEGSDVAQLLATQGRLPMQQAVEYLLQAGEALAEAHAAGIVHRDLKPGNLFVTRRVDGQRVVKVLDFGISKMSGAAGQSGGPITRTSALMGSPLYMSPEQMGSSRDVDARSDLWALGVVLYEMLSGAPPYNGETLPQVCARVMTEPAPPLAERAPDLPPLLCAVVHRCLEKLPASRFQNMAELAQALAPFAPPRGLQSVERISIITGVVPPSAQELASTALVQAVTAPGATSAAASSAAIAPAQLGTQPAWGETNPPQPPARRGRALIAASLMVAAALGGGALWFGLRASEPATGAAGSALTSALPPVPAAKSAAVTAVEPSPTAAAVPLLSAAPTAQPPAAPSEAAAAAPRHDRKPPVARAPRPAEQPAVAATAAPIAAPVTSPAAPRAPTASAASPAAPTATTRSRL